MKKVIELLAKLRKQEIKLILKGDDLEIISYKNKISQDQIHEIKLIKDQIILYLESNNKDRSEYTSSIPKIESNLQNYPVSNAQYRLWLASQNEEGSVAYNTPNTVFLDGNYNIDCFQKALHSVIERHEILRTVFKITDTGEVRQYISSLEETKFSIDFKDYRYEEDPEFSCDAYVTEDSYKLFDLEKGPLLRASLLQISDNRYIFYYNMHHIIGDGVSMEILSRDMMTYYKAFVTSTFPDITPLRIQYKDYAVWQLDQLNSSSFQSHKEYWLSKFRNEVTVLDLPTKKKRLPVKTYKGKGIGTYISPEMTSKLRDFTTERGGSLFMGLLAVWKVLIYRYTGQTDITIGNPVAGRDHPDLEDQIGFYINILPLRNKINPDHNFIQLFDQIKENTLDAFDHQMYPFDRLLEDLNLVRNTSRSPLFDMKMDYHGISENGLVFNDNQDLGSCMVKFDLEIDPTEIAGGINMMFKYNTDVYDHGMIEKFILHYQSLLSCLLSDPIKSINDVHYLSKGETVQLLDDFNSIKIDIPTDKTMVDLFLDNVENHPNNLAVVFGETSLTYKELDEKSNRLAHYLISEKAINKGDFIGIHLDIGLDYMISLLGILKAGCAYVSIDT
ncbi:condensation domain-containing protein, partial [Aquimarina algiphila]|uniref:condensation domain-containing protein n=1 Tax=Aquimarina algiphila TaxID=2047982 RepID=UPI002491C9E0